GSYVAFVESRNRALGGEPCYCGRLLGRALGHVNAPYQGFAQVNRCSALESKTGEEKVTNYLPRLELETRATSPQEEADVWMSLLAGIDLLTGVVHASVEERHRSREFVAFLQKLDAAYPPSTAIKLILDNHSAHVSKETRAWLAAQPEGRFTFVFTPKHGSWLNLVEGFFSKLARSVLRH